MQGVNITNARIGALLHDIGKGGSCIMYCNDNDYCWHDIYNEDLYPPGETDAYHPNYSREIVLGNRPYFLTCEKGKGTKELDVLQV